MGRIQGILLPTAPFPLAGDTRVDSSSERGEEREHNGIGFARNNSTGPSAQHLDSGDSERRSSLFDPFTYDLCEGQLGLEDWFCTGNVLNDYLDFLGGECWLTCRE